MKTQSLLRRSLTAALFLLAATAQAQTLIDQSKALAGNVTPGDTAGFPITISTPGSYKLTSNLVVPDGVIGIEVKANDVTIDLNGYALIGPNSCSYSNGVICKLPAAPLPGVLANGVTGAKVRNGSVRGFVGAGVILRRLGAAEDLSLSENFTGLIAEHGSTVTRVRAALNQNGGIDAKGAVVRDSAAAQNAYGFGVSDGALLIDSIAFGNVGVGLYVNGGAAFQHSVLQGNGQTVLGNGKSLGENLCNSAGC